MPDKHADQGYRKLWSTLKAMTWKERIKHLLFYYGKYAILGAFLIYMTVDVAYDAFKARPEVILSGTAVNVHVSVETEKILREYAFPYVGGTDPEKQEITLKPNKITYTDLYTGSSLQTKLLAGDYHYALMDQTALDMLLSMQALPDLTEVFTEERLAQWEGRFISVQTDGETYPVAIDITGTPLAAGCVYEGDRIFMGFPVNLDTLAVVESFMQYLTDNGLLTIP